MDAQEFLQGAIEYSQRARLKYVSLPLEVAEALRTGQPIAETDAKIDEQPYRGYFP